MGNYTSPEAEAFFGAVGRLTIAWAYLELGLDCMVQIIHYGFGGKDIDPEMPRALQRKISYLRAAFKRMRMPPETEQIYLNIFNQIEAAAQIRHDIIHGIIIEHVESNGEVTIVRALRRKNGVTKKQFKITTTDIMKAALHADRLGSKTLHWATEFYSLIAELSK